MSGTDILMLSPEEEEDEGFAFPLDRVDQQRLFQLETGADVSLDVCCNMSKGRKNGRKKKSVLAQHDLCLYRWHCDFNPELAAQETESKVGKKKKKKAGNPMTVQEAKTCLCCSSPDLYVRISPELKKTAWAETESRLQGE